MDGATDAQALTVSVPELAPWIPNFVHCLPQWLFPDTKGWHPSREISVPSPAVVLILLFPAIISE